MKLLECAFHEYYRKFMIFEADSLTDRLKNAVRVTPEDCFVMCTNIIELPGHLRFPVLALGTSYEECRKGLRLSHMLGTFEAEEVLELPVRLIEPSWEMVRKAARYASRYELKVDDDLEMTREDQRLDTVRDPRYPDVVQVGIVTTAGIQEHPMRLAGFNGPFVEGRLLGQPGVQGLHRDELIRALPYGNGGQYRLLSVFAGDKLSPEDEQAFRELIRQGNQSGFGFSSTTMKS